MNYAVINKLNQVVARPYPGGKHERAEAIQIACELADATNKTPVIYIPKPKFRFERGANDEG